MLFLIFVKSCYIFVLFSITELAKKLLENIPPYSGTKLLQRNKLKNVKVSAKMKSELFINYILRNISPWISRNDKIWNSRIRKLGKFKKYSGNRCYRYFKQMAKDITENTELEGRRVKKRKVNYLLWHHLVTMIFQPLTIYLT